MRRACSFTVRFVILGCALFSVQTTRPAEAQDTRIDDLERRLYLTSMNLIEREWNLNNTPRVLELLAETRGSKFRGFEWGYWNGRCHEESQTILNGQAGIDAVDWAPDGKTILFGAPTDKSVVIRDVATGKERCTIPLTAGVSSALFSPGGNQVVTSAGYLVQVWDAGTGKQIVSIDAHLGAIRAQMTPDGRKVATAGLDGWAHLYDIRDGKEILRIKNRSVGSLYTLAISSDGSKFASGNDGNTALIWDIATGSTLHELKGHTSGICSVAFSPDGKRFAAGSWDCSVIVWDTATGSQVSTLRGHTGAINSIRFSPDSKRVVTASSDTSIKVWDVESGNRLQDLRGHRSAVLSMALSPDGHEILTGSDDGTVKLWDANAAPGAAVAPRRATENIPLVNQPSVAEFENKRSSKLPFRLFGIGVTPPPVSADGLLALRQIGTTVEVWQVRTGIRQSVIEGSHAVGSFAISNDDRQIATGNRDGSVQTWDALPGKLLRTLVGHSVPASVIAFSENGSFLVSGSADATAAVWSTANGRELHTLKGHTSEITAISIQCGGTRIVTGSRDGSAIVWDATVGRKLSALAGQADKVAWALHLTPNGRYAVTTMGQPTLWNTMSGDKIATLAGIGSFWNIVTFSPDSRRILVGSTDGVANMYDVETGRVMLNLNIPAVPQWANNVGFSQDGLCIAVQNGGNPPVVFHAKM